MSGGASRRARAGCHQRGTAETTLGTLRIIDHGRLRISREYWQGGLAAAPMYTTRKQVISGAMVFASNGATIVRHY